MSPQTTTIESAIRWKETLLASNKYYFKTLQPSMLAEDMAVVYAIFDKTTDEVLYVGRTRKLRRRLYTNHLQGNKSTARLKKYIVEDNQNFPEINDYDKAKAWLKENCYFKYAEVQDSRERGHVEGLLGFLLDSRYIEEEH
jgi:predicted GIY-YIG superfamily endonuclease